MIEVRGKYTSAKIFTDTVDKSAMGQIMAMTNLSIFKDCKLRFMPDCHTGKGSLIGTTVTYTDKIAPSIIGPDIGCGMTVYELKKTPIDLPKLDSTVHRILDGAYKKKCSKNFNKEINLRELKCYNDSGKGGRGINLSGCYMSLGSLGGGNHFIELAKGNESGKLYLIIHSGSKLLGASIEAYYMKRALDNLEKTAENKSEIPSLYAYCTGSLMEDYLYDVNMAVEFAKLNRHTIGKRIIKEMKLHIVSEFDTIHNYIDTEDKVIRKGSISAKEQEFVIIPMNNVFGSALCVGKGNEDWNYSAPHGAGRSMSRSEAKGSLGLGEYRRMLKEHNVYTTSVSLATLDEAPMAYKNPKDVIRNMMDTVEVLEYLRPLYNYKSGSR